MLWLYQLLLPVGRAGARLLATRNHKLRDGLAGRAGAEARLRALGTKLEGCVWFHTASVGEYEQARPITALLSEQQPEWPVLHTFFSPSGFEYARKLGEARFIEYLPEDTRGRVRRVLETLRPRALVFVKFDLWPNLLVEADRCNVPVLLFDATLRARSWRSRWPARSLYRNLYERLRLISAVSDSDAARFRALVPRHHGIVVDGDTRFDQVMHRRRSAHRVQLPEALRCGERFTFIAGSTWPPDEERLLPAWGALRARLVEPTPLLVLVPHEPTAAHLGLLEVELTRHSLRGIRYSQVALGNGEALTAHDVLLVDRVGILAELYASADAAYVGGAFTTGVHNVMEPAIHGLPVLFGPRHQNAPEAESLLELGAAGVIRSSADLERQLQALAADTGLRRRMGDRARAFVEANFGASERCLAHLRAMLSQPVAGREIR